MARDSITTCDYDYDAIITIFVSPYVFGHVVIILHLLNVYMDVVGHWDLV